MQDKELIARGAECVCGDLILNRKTVGHYRNGQFIITPEGADILQNVVDVEAVEVKTPKAPKAPTAPKAPKAPKVAPVEAADAAAVDATDAAAVDATDV